MTKLELYVVMGPSGCGKSTFGKWLAEELGTEMLEGDSYHPAENIAKMSQNIPLNDDDRWPWLEKIRQKVINDTASKPDGSILVISCSALKKVYRDRFRNIPGVKTTFVFLNGSFELILERMQRRTDHYMKPEMLKSQFDALEMPGDDEKDVVIVPLEDEQFQDNNVILGQFLKR